MSLADIPHRATEPKPGQTLENLDSITRIVNGLLDEDNIVPGSLTRDSLDPSVLSDLYHANFRQSSWTAFTPTVTASTTNPTMGSGANVSGAYTRMADRLIAVWYYIQFGTSGVNPGSGIYSISLPVTMAGSALGGMNRSADASASATYMSAIFPISTTAFQLINFEVAPSSSFYTHAFPVTWAANDLLMYSSFVYEAAS
jgi:hypothetical protein